MMNTAELIQAIAQNLAWNMTFLAEPVENGVIFSYDPEAPLLDKTGKPTGKTFGKLTTTIIFSDGTKCTCSNSALDRVGSKLVTEVNGVKLPTPVLTADDSAKEAGIVNCIFKRLIGNVGKNGKINGSGGSGWLKQKIATSYDQNVMEVYNKAIKKIQAAANAEAQKKAVEKAKQKKVKRLAKQMALEKEAAELAQKLKTAKTASGFSGKPLTEASTKPQPKTASAKCGGGGCCSEDSKPYTRPAKRFSEFTQEEKRAYWRAQKRGLV